MRPRRAPRIVTPVELETPDAATLEAAKRQDLATCWLFTVEPTDRALAGWGLGSTPYTWLGHMARARRPQ